MAVDDLTDEALRKSATEDGSRIVAVAEETIEVHGSILRPVKAEVNHYFKVLRTFYEEAKIEAKTSRTP